MKKEISSFGICDNGDNTFHIECVFTVYYEKFKHYPKFIPMALQETDFGCYTNFFYLVEDNLTYEKAKKNLAIYRAKYDKRIKEIENNDLIWDKFPFKNCVLVFYK